MDTTGDIRRAYNDGAPKYAAGPVEFFEPVARQPFDPEWVPQ